MKQFIFSKGNFSFLIFYFLFSIISIISIFLAEYNNNKISMLFVKQLFFYILGFFILYIIQKINIHTYKKISIPFFILTIIILVILLFSSNTIAPEVNGSKSWFNFSFFSIQPSEIVKTSTVLMMSYLISQKHFKLTSDIIKLFEIILIIMVPFILITKQNDIGNALFFLFLFLILTFIVCEKNKISLIIYSIISFIVSLFIFLSIYFPKYLTIFGFKNYQIKRVNSWIFPEKFTQNFSYQITQIINEMSKGKLYGTFSKNINYIDEQYNDFILSIIAKNFGFIGATFFIFIFFVFIYKILRISKKCKNGTFYYYFLFLSSFSFLFGFIFNTYSTTSLIPVIGVSIPFISYGGSSLISNTILLGIIIKINNTIYKELSNDN